MEQKELEKTLKQLHPLERKVLSILKSAKSFPEAVKLSGLQEVEVMRALEWLENRGAIKLEKLQKILVELDGNGQKYLREGLPEKRFLFAMKNIEGGVALSDIKRVAMLTDEEAQVSLGLLKKRAAIEIQTNGALKAKLTSIGKSLLEKLWLEEKFLHKNFPIDMANIVHEDKYAYEELKKRKNFLATKDVTERKIILTDFGKQLTEQKMEDKDTLGSLTPGMLKMQAWKGKEFRHYDVKINVPKIYGGRRHPLQESINQVRRIFMDMGFKEMEGPLVETAFWCMDSMWIPQDHPARDAQDTFYLPYEGRLPEKLSKKVAEEHEFGGRCGSKGYGYKWSPALARQLLLRTHTTATTFRYFGEKNIKPPAKYFYIGRIFRNESIDATHLPEFHQSEGFIMDENLTLRDLMGYIKEFYHRMGIEKIKFKPTYNPYTEPSMEALGYNEQLGKWVELINSGIFRPESLEPYGINVPVIAWGLGIERLAMMLHQQKDIRNMMGATGSLNWFRQHKSVGLR